MRKHFFKCYNHINSISNEIESLCHDGKISENLLKKDFLRDLEFERGMFVDLKQIECREKKEGEKVDTEIKVGT